MSDTSVTIIPMLAELRRLRAAATPGKVVMEASDTVVRLTSLATLAYDRGDGSMGNRTLAQIARKPITAGVAGERARRDFAYLAALWNAAEELIEAEMEGKA